MAENESAGMMMGDDVLAQSARELVAVMQRDVKTDWIVRADVRASPHEGTLMCESRLP